MNILAPTGTKVTATAESMKNGYAVDKAVAAKYLKIGGVYTLQKIEVDNWSSTVWLAEFPGVSFNSASLADIEEVTL